jgi:hypothetical protein
VSDTTRLPIRRRLGRAERPEDGERGGQVLERVRLVAGAAAGGDVEKLSEQNHRGVRLSGSAGAGNDDRLGIPGLALEPDGLLDDPAEGRRVLVLGGLPGRRQGQRVADVAVGIDGQDDGSDVSLKLTAICYSNVQPYLSVCVERLAMRCGT